MFVFSRTHFLILWILFFSLSALAVELNPEEILDREAMEPDGLFYEATVPDTLDLADRARMAINNLTRAPWDTVLSAESLTDRYGDESLLTREVLSEKIEASPPFINVKQLRTLPKLRAMCGSDQNLDAEYEAMKKLLQTVADAKPEAGNYASGMGIRAVAMPIMNWYHRDGNEDWLKWLAYIADAIKLTIIQVEDRAYYPTSAEKNQFVQYTPPDEQPIDQVGREGTVRWDQSWALRALTRDYLLNGDEVSIELARKNMRFLLKPGMWKDTGDLNFPGHEHGLWEGHYHGGLTGLQAMLDFAKATDDEWLKQFIAEAYGQGRHNGVVRMGWVPMWFPTASFNRPKEQSSYCEACGIADLTIMAVKLSSAGMGDYWDDVDYYVRNQLTEQQFIDMDLMRKSAGNKPEFDPLLERMFGGFGLSDTTVHGYCYTDWQPQVVTGCCSPNAAISLYYVWHSIVQFDQGIATVNLLLNRASPWLDVDSYLPYEGKVVLHNKKAHTALVRIPHWVDKEKVLCKIDEKNINLPFAGQYSVIQNLKPNDEITIEFPVPEYKNDKYTIFGKEYLIDYRGSTIVDIQPRGEGPYPLYQREHFKARKAPMKTVKRYVAEKLIPLP